MAYMIGHASIDENGKISGGAAGDQTGKEVCTRTFYVHKYGWDTLRAKDDAVAELIAVCMEEACENPCVGYDQVQRLSLYDTVKNLKFKCDMNTLKVFVECDCSSLVRVCLARAGINVGNFTTANEKTVIMETGLFDLVECSSDGSNLKRGDILISKKKGHTAVFLSNPRTVSITRAVSVYEWQCAAIKDGFKFPKYGADGDWGAECESVAKNAIVKKRTENGKNVYKYTSLTRIVQRIVGATVDGKFGDKTKALVINYQKANGLNADGAVGLNTWRKMIGV